MVVSSLVRVGKSEGDRGTARNPIGTNLFPRSYQAGEMQLSAITAVLRD